MWTEFEWENKVNVNTTIDNLRVCESSDLQATYSLLIAFLADLNHIMASTNMSCLTPDAALSGDCGFLSANMYARSLFGTCTLPALSMTQLTGEDAYRRGRASKPKYRKASGRHSTRARPNTVKDAGDSVVAGRQE